MSAALPAGLAWKLNRLRCMTPAEIGHRVVRAAAMQAERWGFVRCEVPAPDLAATARSWIHLDAAIDAAPYLAAADRIIAGRHDVFALRDIDLGNPPRWNRDPKTGIEAPLDFGKQLDYRDPARVGDCKYLWEPNRHLHLVTLAQAYALSGDMKYAATLRRHLESWLDACPFRMGANWASSLEAGLRLANWSLAWQLLGGARSPVFEGADGEAFRARWLESVYQHAEFVAGHFSLHSSANNHLIGEASGLYLGAMAWPHWPRARQWRGAAREILEREALLQNAPDGVNREQATSYQQFTFDLLLLPLLAARANGDDFPAAYRERLESMLAFLASIMDAGGNVPMFGDADDAYVARLDPREGFCRYKSLLATGALLFDRGDFKARAGTLDDKTRWLLGEGAAERFARLPASAGDAPIRRYFPEGGYYVLGCDFGGNDEIRIVADAGPLGYREIAAHGHADALSFTLSRGGVEMLIDPGTYAYHTQSEWRAYFRGTAAHNTVRVDGRDQSQPGGNFMWLRKANARCLVWSSTGDEDRFEGCHDGYMGLEDPVMHRRRLVLDKRSRTLVVEDKLQMRGAHAIEFFLHCAEGSVVEPIEGGVAVTRQGRALRVRWPELAGGHATVLEGSEEPKSGWVSRRFDEKVPAPTLVWRGTFAGDTLLRTVIDLD
ncbi:MAG TPA: alginate lyase family protein [Usitatibacter sp.]|nr:alginate lyase family protein [Usitatibacter sp.]